MGTSNVPTDQSRTQIKDVQSLGSILTEMLHSDLPLAQNFRKFMASKESNAEKGDAKHE